MTREPPPTTAWAPITHGPRTMALLATQAPSPMTMSRPLRGMASCRSRPNLLMSWVPVRTETLWPKKAYSPTVMSPEPTLNRALLTTAVGWTCSRDRSPWTRYLYISTWASGPACRGSCSARTWRSGSCSQRASRRATSRSSLDIRASCFSPARPMRRGRHSIASALDRGVPVCCDRTVTAGGRRWTDDDDRGRGRCLTRRVAGADLGGRRGPPAAGHPGGRFPGPGRVLQSRRSDQGAQGVGVPAEPVGGDLGPLTVREVQRPAGRRVVGVPRHQVGVQVRDGVPEQLVVQLHRP